MPHEIKAQMDHRLSSLKTHALLGPCVGTKRRTANKNKMELRAHDAFYGVVFKFNAAKTS